MILPKCTLLLGLILTLLLDPISGKRGFGGSHSYPKSGGLSGGGHRSGGLSGGGHGYPSSGGSHGYPSSGGSHGYPSGGLSGGGHGYPSSGGSHGYPSSGGSHGYPSSGGNHGYPSSGGSYPSAVKPAHTYPSSNNHGYPASPGLSGHNYPSNNKPVSHHTTYVNHYHYSPPSQISYTPVRGSPPVHYPVYHGTPPTYVYQYKDSGSKYGTLLAGLALMNLGTLGVAGYAAYKANQNHGGPGGPSQYTYTPQKGEICKFAIKKENGDYEETKIDCQIISGFILQDEAQRSGTNQSTITTTTTVTNVTTVNTNVGGETPVAPPTPNVLYQMLPNGTLVPVITNATIPGVIPNVPAPGDPNSSMTVTTNVTTTTNTTLVSALDVKGKPVEVTAGMECYVIRITPISKMKKSVPCGLLQTYADQSISRRSSATRNVPMFTVAVAVLAYCFA